LASTAIGEKRVRIWNAAKGERDRELGPFPGVAQEVKWSRDGRLVTFNVPGVGWHIWDVEQGRLVNDPKQWKVYWCELSPDGRSVLTAPGERDVYRLRDLASGKDGARLPFSHSVHQAHPTWSPDGRQLAIAVASSIEVWHSDLNKRLWWLGQPGGASQMAFWRDGKLVAGLNGERLFVWETDTGRQRGILVLGRRNNALTVAPEGHYTGNENTESGIAMLVEKEDGTQEILEPAEFKRKYGFKNDPNKVHLLQAMPSK
jgi:WD40 repeat protein